MAFYFCPYKIDAKKEVGKMRKVLMSVMLLLVLSAVTPVMATPAAKIPFTSEASFGFGNIYPGKSWTTEDGIRHVKGAISEGTTEVHSVFGNMSGNLTIIHDLVIDQNTGLGDCHGKFVITVFDITGTVVLGTFEGSEHGAHTITDHHYISGNLVAKGTGMFEGLKMAASYEGEMITVDTQQVVEITMTGTLLSPEG